MNNTTIFSPAEEILLLFALQMLIEKMPADVKPRFAVILASTEDKLKKSNEARAVPERIQGLKDFLDIGGDEFKKEMPELVAMLHSMLEFYNQLHTYKQKNNE